MSLLGRLFGKPGFIRFDDSYALERASLWEPMGESVHQEVAAGNKVLLIVHFTEMFTQIQEQLESWKIDYNVVTSPLNERELDLLRKDSAGVYLVLAELLPDPAMLSSNRDSRADANQGGFSFIVCDLHPTFTPDNRIEKLARQLPERVRMGYFLAMDDVVIRRAVGDTTVQVLEQMGLGNRESLIASNVVSRRLAKIQKRNEAAAAGNQAADSAAEWFELNLPGSD